MKKPAKKKLPPSTKPVSARQAALTASQEMAALRKSLWSMHMSNEDRKAEINALKHRMDATDDLMARNAEHYRHDQAVIKAEWADLSKRLSCVDGGAAKPPEPVHEEPQVPDQLTAWANSTVQRAFERLGLLRAGQYPSQVQIHTGVRALLVANVADLVAVELARTFRHLETSPGEK